MGGRGWCLYCDDQPVGWIQNSTLSLREVGPDYLPESIKRPAKGDTIQELAILRGYVNADWLPRAFQDTAVHRKRGD